MMWDVCFASSHQSMNKYRIFVFFLALLCIGSFACRRDQITTSSSAKLDFSVDTILFDTVFTTLGSTTAALRVYNNNDEKVSISSIDLWGGTESQYRMNVDGINGPTHSDIEINGKDSLWIFVEVTVDPGNINIPFIVEDSIVFMTNGNRQSVILNAWGQDAHFHGSLGGAEYLGNCDEVWNNDKPHVLYGIIGVDSCCSLTINPGTQVYCHDKSGIFVYKGALEVNGELGSEVVFQGDRLEPFYDDLAGQWGIEVDIGFETDFGVEFATITRGGIYLYQSKESTIDYAIIKNGIIGLQVDTTDLATGYNLTMNNTKIMNMSAIGLLSRGGTIQGDNNEITNCGQSCAALTLGGSYHFRHCTFANFWTESNRQAPSFYLSNYYVDVNDDLQIRNFGEAVFENCIMHGNNAQLSDFSEWILDLEDLEVVSYEFSSCYVDSDEDLSDDGAHFFNMKKSENPPPFIDPFEDNFDFPSGISSQFDGFNVGVTFDIKGQTRTTYTVGAHEKGD